MHALPPNPERARERASAEAGVVARVQVHDVERRADAGGGRVDDELRAGEQQLEAVLRGSSLSSAPRSAAPSARAATRVGARRLARRRAGPPRSRRSRQGGPTEPRASSASGLAFGSHESRRGARRRAPRGRRRAVARPGWSLTLHEAEGRARRPAELPAATASRAAALAVGGDGVLEVGDDRVGAGGERPLELPGVQKHGRREQQRPDVGEGSRRHEIWLYVRHSGTVKHCLGDRSGRALTG